MSLTDRTKLGETFNSPAELSDHQLLNMPLRNLSKGISLTISLSTTARVYLRWIELHRVQKTKFTEHWDNTILHWIQSLRARGFKEQDIINEMRFWKQKTGPLPSVEGRRLPELCDIEKAYKEISECSGETKSKDKTNWKHEIPRVDLPISYDDEPRRPYYAKEENSFEKYRSFPKKKLYENLQGPPPPSYVCNRCGKKGHHLQVCPTNMDPDFDKPPDYNYTCTICNSNGKHYKSLCPKNSDPLSIIQRRKVQGVKTSSIVSPSLTRDTAQREELIKISQSDRDIARLSREPQYLRIIPTSHTFIEDHPANVLRRTETAQLSYPREDVVKMESSYGRLSRKRSFSPSTDDSFTAPRLRIERKKFRRTNETLSEDSRTERRVEEPDNTTQAIDDLLIACCVDSTSNMRQHDGNTNAEAEVLNPDEIDIGSDHDYRLDISEHDLQPTPDLDPSNFGTVQHLISRMLVESSNEDDDMAKNADPPSPMHTHAQPNNKYSEFIRKLIRRRGEMTEVMNKIAKRPSAIMMWKDASDRRLESTLTASFLSSPISSTENPEVRKTELLTSCKTFDPRTSPKILQLDGADEEEILSDTSRSFPRRKKKLSEFGKGAFGKVKGAAKELGTLRGRARTRLSPNQKQPLISRSPSPPLPCPKDHVRILAPISSNIPRVLVTSLPAQSCNKDLPKLPSSKRVTYQPERLATSLPAPQQKPSGKENRRLLHSSSIFSARGSSRDSALSVSRSTNEFRSTVRKIIEESKAEDLRKSTETILQPQINRPKIGRSMSQIPNSNSRAVSEFAKLNTPNAHEQVSKHVTFRDRGRCTPVSEASKEAREANLEDLKNFGHNFKLKTAMPEDLDFLKGGHERELKDNDTCEGSNESAARELNHVKFGRKCHDAAGACDIGIFDMSSAQHSKNSGTAFESSPPKPDDLEYIASPRYEKTSTRRPDQDAAKVDHGTEHDGTEYNGTEQHGGD